MFLIATVEFLLLLAQLEIIGLVGQRGSFQVVASTRQCYSWRTRKRYQLAPGPG
jgi:hypothetical protein